MIILLKPRINYGMNPQILSIWLCLFPILQFGSIVMTHVPVDLQSTLHPKSICMIAVGSFMVHQGGILLYNPLTNKVVTRRTFK